MSEPFWQRRGSVLCVFGGLHCKRVNIARRAAWAAASAARWAAACAGVNIARRAAWAAVSAARSAAACAGVNIARRAAWAAVSAARSAAACAGVNIARRAAWAAASVARWAAACAGVNIARRAAWAAASAARSAAACSAGNAARGALGRCLRGRQHCSARGVGCGVSDALQRLPAQAATLLGGRTGPVCTVSCARAGITHLEGCRERGWEPCERWQHAHKLLVSALDVTLCYTGGGALGRKVSEVKPREPAVQQSIAL
eukprot:XP_001701239.1 predicted protein [Chlamydomonas reinhardtii]